MTEPGTVTETQGHPSEGGASSGGFFSPEVNLLILTWITFFFLLAILSKFAFKPILHALENRERGIKKAIEDAEKIKQELEQVQHTRDQMLRETELATKNIINEARKTAVEAARLIEQGAQDEAKAILENAKREIDGIVDEAKLQLRREGADLAVQLASKLIEENLDKEKNRKIIDQFIKNF